MEPLIRRYEPRDYDDVWTLHLEGVMATRMGRLVDPKYEEDLRDIQGEYLSQGSCLWVAEAGDSLVGMAAIQRIDAQTGRLRRMRVTTAWRRKGLARALLLTAERFCREQAYNRIILDTMKSQTAAHRLYESDGFVFTGEHALGAVRVFFYEKVLQ